MFNNSLPFPELLHLMSVEHKNKMEVCLHTKIYKDNHKHVIYETVTTGVTLTDVRYYNQ